MALRQASSWASSVCLPRAGAVVHAAIPGFHSDAEDANSGPDAGTAGAELTEPPP